MSTSVTLAFLVGTLAVMAVPGPSVLFVVTRTLEAGRTAGLISVLGIEAALSLHVTAGVAGLTVIVASSEIALSALRYLGAAYLVVLAVRQLRLHPPSAPDAPVAAPVGSRWRHFREAFVVDALNPKTGLFFLAFLPQFVDPALGRPGPQILVLGFAAVTVAVVCDAGWVLATSRVAGRSGSLVSAVGVRRAAGIVYVGLATLVVVG